MKKTFYVLGILLWILFPGKASGQNDNYCYVRTRTMTKPNSWGYYDEISYYNAAGKVCQSYLKGYTPQQKTCSPAPSMTGLAGSHAPGFPYTLPKTTWLPMT